MDEKPDVVGWTLAGFPLLTCTHCGAIIDPLYCATHMDSHGIKREEDEDE